VSLVSHFFVLKKATKTSSEAICNISLKHDRLTVCCQ